MKRLALFLVNSFVTLGIASQTSYFPKESYQDLRNKILNIEKDKYIPLKFGMVDKRKSYGYRCESTYFTYKECFEPEHTGELQESNLTTQSKQKDTFTMCSPSTRCKWRAIENRLRDTSLVSWKRKNILNLIKEARFESVKGLCNVFELPMDEMQKKVDTKLKDKSKYARKLNSSWDVKTEQDLIAILQFRGGTNKYGGNANLDACNYYFTGKDLKKTTPRPEQIRDMAVRKLVRSGFCSTLDKKLDFIINTYAIKRLSFKMPKRNKDGTINSSYTFNSNVFCVDE